MLKTGFKRGPFLERFRGIYFVFWTNFQRVRGVREPLLSKNSFYSSNVLNKLIFIEIYYFYCDGTSWFVNNPIIHKKVVFMQSTFYYSIEYRIYSCMKNRILSYSYSLQRKSTPRWWWNNHGSPSSSIHGYSDPRRKSSRGIFHHRFSVNNSAINTFSTVCSFFFHSLLFY